MDCAVFLQTFSEKTEEGAAVGRLRGAEQGRAVTNEKKRDKYKRTDGDSDGTGGERWK